MITEQDLQEAIAECQGVRNPNASTCIKLAAFLTIQKEMYGQNTPAPAQNYSYDSGPVGEDNIIYLGSGTEFADIIGGMRQSDVLAVMDELMSTLQLLQPRLYASVLRKLKKED